MTPVSTMAGLREAIARCLCQRKWDRPSAIEGKAEWRRLGFASLDAAVDYDWSTYAGSAADVIIAGPLADLLSRARAAGIPVEEVGGGDVG